MNLFKKSKYLLAVLLASFCFVTFVPQFSYAQNPGAESRFNQQNPDVAPGATNDTGAAMKDAGNKVVNWLAESLGHIVYFFTVRLPSLILVLEIKMFRWVGTYNGFATQPQVVQAWGTVRDLANMFFILVLLLMAFGTILQVQGYGYRQLLSRLLIMAILINFSKSIVALLIDFSQIVTLTFLAPVIDTLSGSLVVALGLTNIMKLAESSSTSVTGVSFLMAMILGGIMMIITTVIMGVILIMFLMRVITLWILIVLAPVAFLAHTFPQTDRYYKDWENELSKNLTLGPALAFFIWLALSIVGQGNISDSFGSVADIDSSGGVGSVKTDDASLQGIFTEVSTTSNMLNFVIAISLLMAGLKFASQSGAAGASFAGKASSNLQKWGSKAARMPLVGTSGEGGLKGVGSRMVGTAGIGLAATVGNVPLIGGGFKRAGLQMQAMETRRRQRKQAIYNKRYAGMSEEQQQEYNETYQGMGKFALGAREGRANLFRDELRRTRGAISPERAKQLQAGLRAAGDFDSLEKLEARSGALLNGDKLNRLVEKMGPAALSNLNLEGASQEVIEAVANLSGDVLTKGFEGMSDDIRKKAMAAIDPIVNSLDGDMKNEDSSKYKARILQAKYSAKSAETNGLAADFNNPLLTNDQKKKFLQKAKLSGEDVIKFDTSGTESGKMFDYISANATQSQASAMVSNLSNDAQGEEKLKRITKARVRAGKVKEMETMAGGIGSKYIEDSDVSYWVHNIAAPMPPAPVTPAQRALHDKQLKDVATRNLDYAHTVYSPTTNRAAFISFVETLSLEQLKKMDQASLKTIKGSVNPDTQARFDALKI